MSIIAAGSSVPAFTLSATSGRNVNETDLLGKITILYFYPKDDTPGCTTEGEDFSKKYRDFTKLGVQIYGVSRDNLKSHENFKAKFAFPFELLSDSDGLLCEAFGVIKEKYMYGRKVLGIERSTFLIGANGTVQVVWRGVKVPGHVDEVLAAVQSLKSGVE